MSINIRYPNISGFTEKEQIAQIRSYLHQLVEQLNYAIPKLGTGDGSTQTKSTNTSEVQSGELSYYDLRSLIIQKLQEVDALFDNFSKKMESEYVRIDEMDSIVSQAMGKISFTMDEDGNLYYEVEE